MKRNIRFINLNDKYFAMEVPLNAYDFSMRRNNQVIYSLRGVISELSGSEKSEIVEIPDTKFSLSINDWNISGLIENGSDEIAAVMANANLYWKNPLGQRPYPEQFKKYRSESKISIHMQREYEYKKRLKEWEELEHSVINGNLLVLKRIK